MFSPWEADDTSLNKIYAVQSDPVAQVVPHYEVGFEPEECRRRAWRRGTRSRHKSSYVVFPCVCGLLVLC